MRKTTLDLLLDNLSNLSNRIHAVEIAFIDFTEENPKSSDQWQEERLRALEAQVKAMPVHVLEDDSDNEFNYIDNADLNEKLDKVSYLYQKVNTMEPIFNKHIQRFDALWSDHQVAVQRIETLSSKFQLKDLWELKDPTEKIGHMQQQIADLQNNLSGIQFGHEARMFKLENRVCELQLALENLTKELQDMKDAKA